MMILLTEEEKRKIAEYLYPTKRDEKFLVKTVYRDLKQIIPQNLCFCTSNLVRRTRKRNYAKVAFYIREYFRQHDKYREYLEEDYPPDMDDILYDNQILNFVFCLTQDSARLKDVHIFKDKRSICYTELSVIEVEFCR